MAPNALSALGKMSYGAHLLIYPTVFGSAYYFGSNYSAKSSAASRQSELDNMPKLRAVDPDLFNPFSAIPFHNNLELKYRYADLNMHKYLNSENHLNAKEYTYKTYHDSYDHDGKKEYMYTWVSMSAKDDVKLREKYTLKQ